MTGLICDTSGLLAYFDASDAHCAEMSSAIEAESGPFIVSPYVVAELDYLLATRRGVELELLALAELSSGAWELAVLDTQSLESICDVISKYKDQQIGVADASLVVLAERYRTERVLTLDKRHFNVMRTESGRPFTLLPQA